MSQPMMSPFSLIQEGLWPNEWLILVSCVLLNCTSRKQVERVMPVFMKEYNTPEKLLSTEREHVLTLVSPLGFKNRRTKTLYALAEAYTKNVWKDPRDLPGIGEYAYRAWSIFIKNDLGLKEPDDGALRTYFQWRKQNDCKNRINVLE